MKRILALAFLSLYLFSTTEFHELLKLPAMAEHYDEHKKEKPEISVWQFLCIHYAHGDVNDHDHDKDMKLPFKTHDNCSSPNFISLIPEHKFTIEKQALFVTAKNTPNYYKEVLTTHSYNSIWQPPKIS
ncbi:hypothetical protein EZL74_09675 [Flavobacterium silvisoli]|uniref:Uncharacterized protein n=1 Tax=Flavobacterium silvisoli TaxID=2529433 RepID=A0A4Q9YXH2_9FLAO|nr:hypothetical protein [Flavobacterium silvisoli]TBX67530.1 hypothetical protein EZL74_09675 [Flavobacterium silvisoli]